MSLPHRIRRNTGQNDPNAVFIQCTPKKLTSSWQMWQTLSLTTCRALQDFPIWKQRVLSSRNTYRGHGAFLSHFQQDLERRSDAECNPRWQMNRATRNVRRFTQKQVSCLTTNCRWRLGWDTNMSRRLCCCPTKGHLVWCRLRGSLASIQPALLDNLS